MSATNRQLLLFFLCMLELSTGKGRQVINRFTALNLAHAAS